MATHFPVKPVAPIGFQDSSNHIDLTSDDDEELEEVDYSRFAKRPRVEEPPKIPGPSRYPMAIPSSSLRNPSHFQPYAPSNLNPTVYRPAFAPSPAYLPPRHYPNVPPPPAQQRLPSGVPDPRVIDLTGSPSPPPPPTTLPAELPPKTPVCIGQLGVTALVLYPVPYLLPQGSMGEEWAPVRLQYEHSPNKPGGSETIHIKASQARVPNGEQSVTEAFGVVEQKVATALGPMLGKGLIRLDAKVRKGPPNVSMYQGPLYSPLT